jgi:hypothetical protein
LFEIQSKSKRTNCKTIKKRKEWQVTNERKKGLVRNQGKKINEQLINNGNNFEEIKNKITA